MASSLKIRKATTRIIWHHSLADKSSVADIDDWHKERGFCCIGYHFVIRRNGTIEDGRGIDYVGAHALGRNADSIGVCFEGDFRLYKPSYSQVQSSLHLYISLCEKYLKTLVVEFHRSTFNPCPGKFFDRIYFTEILYREISVSNLSYMNRVIKNI